MSIFKGFLRGNPQSDDAAPPSEKFQDEQAVLNSTALALSNPNMEGKILIGLAGAKVVIDPKQPRLPDGRSHRYSVAGKLIAVGEDRHVTTIAGTRGGKGRNSIIPNLLIYPGSILILDPKAEAIGITGRRRAALGQSVYSVDPFKEGDQEFAATFNPMDSLVGSTDLVADAGLISDALIVPDAGAHDSHWDNSSMQLVETLILHVATSPLYAGRRHLVQVYELLWKLLRKDPADRGDGRFALQVEMDENSAANGAVMHGSSDFYDRSDKERDSVLSTARRHLHFLGYDAIQRTLKTSSFDLRDLKRKPTSIFLCLPARRLATCSRFFRLILNNTLAAMEMEKTQPRYPVLMILDEYHALGHMKTLETAAAQLGGFGVKLWIFLQDLAQLRATHDQKWETFLANSGVIQAFANSDLTTLEWLARRLGTTTVTNQSQNAVPYQTAASDSNSGKSRSTATCELMSAGEIARFFGRDDELLRQLIIRPSVPPIVLQRCFYDKHEFFRGMFTPKTDR